MPSLRKPASSALLRAVARVLIPALLFSLVPPPRAEASIQAPPPPVALASRALPDLAAPAPPAMTEVLVCVVVVVVADPLWLTKSAFGELLAHTGSDPQPYAFAGEPYDPNSGFQYHRARWMDPRIGWFVTMDEYEGLILDPLTLHRFAYASTDPVNRIDPSGRVSNFFYGTLVHDIISDDFEATGPGRITNRGGSFVFGRLPLPLGRYRPDLIDTLNKQLFEIKTIREWPEGLAKLRLYLLIFNWADPDKTRPWTAGTAQVYSPTQNIIPLDTWGTYAIVAPPQ